MKDRYLEIESLLNSNTLNRKKSIISMQKKIADMLISHNIKFDIMNARYK